MTEKFLLRAIYGGLFALLIVPFIVSDSLFFPFITGKTFFFRLIVEGMVLAWAGLMVFNSSYRPRWTPITIALLAFIVIIGLADVFGVNPGRSFWSNFERMEGFITIAHVVALVFVVGSTIKSTNIWKAFCVLSLGSSFLLALRGLSQLADSTHENIRISATLGNPTYFAVYLLFNIFIAVALAYQVRTKRLYALICVILAAFLVVCLYHTGTRGALIGLMGGFSVTALIFIVRGHATPVLRKLSIAFIVLLVVAATAFVGLRDSELVQNNRRLERLAGISLTDKTTQSRLTLWSSIGWEGFKERPILGWGQDNFIVVFGKYYDPIMYKQEPWFDRAHNIFVDWAIAGGLLGLLSYLSLFGMALFVLWRTKMDVVEKAIITGVLVAYAIHNFFVFDNITSYTYFALLLGYLSSRVVLSDGTVSERGSLAIKMFAGVLVLVAVASVIVNARITARAHTLLGAVRASYASAESGVVLELYERALSYNRITGLSETREQLAQSLNREYSRSTTDEKGLEEISKRTIEELVVGAEREPDNTRPLYFLATTLRSGGRTEEARVVLDEALGINPTRQLFLYEYAQTYMSEKNFEKAREFFKKAYDIEPENDTAFVYYIVTSIYAGDQAGADALLVERFGTTIVDNAMLFEAYKRTGKTDRVIDILRLRLEDTDLESSKRAAIHISLAGLYAQEGNRAQAIEETQRAINLHPPFAEQGEQMIKAIQAGQRIQITQ